MAAAPVPRSSSKLAPALPLGALQFTRAVRAGILDLFERLSKLGGVARFQSPLYVAHLVTQPDAVRHVLQENPSNYQKDARSAKIMRAALGDGLFLRLA